MELREIVQTAQAKMNAARSALNEGDTERCKLELEILCGHLCQEFDIIEVSEKVNKDITSDADRIIDEIRSLRDLIAPQPPQQQPEV